MRLATLRDGSRDGALIVVDPTGSRYAAATDIAPTLQTALDTWHVTESRLRALAETLAQAPERGQRLDVTDLAAPLPRAFEWIDGSAYVNHVVLVRKARAAEPPADLLETPLVYQGGSGVMLAPTAPLELPDPSWDLDFEAEVAVVLGDVPLGTTAAKAGKCVRLLLLANDATYRGLVPGELARGFGFFQSKPATAFSPFAATPDELGTAYEGGRIHLRLRTELNGALVGDVDAGPEMHFSFFDLVAHVAKTRAFVAGTILGSGTVSNAAPERGVSCLVERRARETIEHGTAQTPYLRAGDRVRIEMFDRTGRSVFGAIEQVVQ